MSPNWSYTAVAVTYHRPNGLAKCLDALLQQRANPNLVIVVNNESCQRTHAVCRQHSLAAVCDIHVLDQRDNLGPAGGFQVGIDWLLANVEHWDEWVLLQDDNDPVPEGSISSLLTVAKELGTAVDAIGGIGLRGGNLNSRTAIIGPPRRSEAHPSVAEVDHLHGNSCPIYKLAALHDAGGMRSELFFGFEELDLGLRIVDRGWRMFVIAQPVGEVDMNSRSAIGKVRIVGPLWRHYYSLRNLIVILREQRGSWIRVALVRGIGKGLINAIALQPRSGALSTAFWAVMDALSGRLGRRYVTPRPPCCGRRCALESS